MSVKIALAGNPNSGKTTLFNALTGSNQFVGNWPGVTVEKKEGKMKSNSDVIVTDLPGIYSLSPYTLEEVVSRNYLINERPDAILNIVDGTNIERNLYLTTQLIELGIPVVIAINMMDVVRKRGEEINITELSYHMGCDVVEISALKSEGIEEAAQKAIDAALSGPRVPTHLFSGEVEHAIAHIEEAAVHNLPEEQQRWYAIKIFERDERVIKKLNLSSETIDHIEKDILYTEKKFDDDAESIITNERYEYIDKVMIKCGKKRNLGRLKLSDKIDRIVTNRILALPIFALVMFIVYYVSVTTVGTWATDWANDGVFGEGWSLFGLYIPGIPTLVGNLLTSLNVAPWLESLILDGIVSGVGAVLGFVPQMFVLFIFLAFLEGCGYMARIAFIMDRIFRKFGLSGKSFIPMLIGTGCGVPGIMASRTIENDRDRKMTVITTTFIPCSAKLPIIALIAGAMFNGAPWVAPSAYFLGIAAIVISGIILKKSKLFAGDAAPFVMELPEYHMPTVSNILRSMWERGWSFVKKAGTVILLSTVVLWFFQCFGFENGAFTMVENINNSILAYLGNLFAWIFTPLGWGDWKAAVAALTGLIAKENVVATFGVIFGAAEVSEGGTEIWGMLASEYSAVAMYSFLAFNLLCAPCFAAIGAIRREMNNTKWTLFAICYQTVFAYMISLCIYQFGLVFLGGSVSIGTAVAIAIVILGIYLMVRPVRKNS
ncbi:MAG: ferrous iron transport protein B [Clostridia bacterium]